MEDFKNLITPLQKALLTKRLCPGCTSPLDKAKSFPFDPNQDIVICTCRRMYMYDKGTDSFRRATLEEAEEFARK